MNALEILKQDHDDIRKLFADAKTYADIKQLFGSVKVALEVHAHIEETVFYPRYLEYEHLKDLVQDAKTQHELIKELLRDVDHSDGAEFENGFQTLMAEVQLHFIDEENEIFPQVRSLSDGPDLGLLGQELQSHKAQCSRVHGA